MTALAWLCAAELALGNIDAALEHSAKALTFNEIPLYPLQEIFWWRYQALVGASRRDGAFCGDDAGGGRGGAFGRGTGFRVVRGGGEIAIYLPGMSGVVDINCDVGEGGHDAFAHMPDPQLDGLGLAIDVKEKLLVAHDHIE